MENTKDSISKATGGKPSNIPLHAGDPSSPRHTRTSLGSFLRLCIFLLAADIAIGLYFCLSIGALRVVIPVCAASASVIVAAALYIRVLPRDYSFAWKFVFPIIYLVIGLSYTLFLSPMAVPDEVYHYTQSYAYSSLMLTGHHDIFRKADLDFINTKEPGGTTLSAENWRNMNREINASVELSDLQSVVDTTRGNVFDSSANPIQVKFVSALGITAGRMLGLNALRTFYLGRLFALVFGIAVISLAVRITPVGKNSMMAVALFPMTLQLLGSYSYDSGIIALAFLLTALVLRLSFGDSPTPAPILVFTLLVAVLLAPCKLVYYPIAFLALLAPQKRFASRKTELAYKSLLIILPITAIVIVRLTAVVDLAEAQGSQIDHRGSETGTFYSLSNIFRSPLAFYAMLLRTFQILGDFHLTGIVGGSLGWFQQNIEAPHYFSYAILFISFIASLPSRDDSATVPINVRIMSVLLFIASSGAVFLSMYLGWTFNTEQVIMGVQGRYFIPLLPMLFLALRTGHITVQNRTAMPVLTVLVSTDFMYLAYIAMCVLIAK